MFGASILFRHENSEKRPRISLQAWIQYGWLSLACCLYFIAIHGQSGRLRVEAVILSKQPLLPDEDLCTSVGRSERLRSSTGFVTEI